MPPQPGETKHHVAEELVAQHCRRFNIILNMKQSQPGQSGQQIIKIINIGHHLVDNIHNQASMILKKVMQRILAISMNLANNQDPKLNPHQHL